ncbi:hypothetical protein D3C86_868060 [compost metagenome]
MPNSVNISTVPTRAPASLGGKCSRTMIAYEGTMPPWNRPNSAEITYSGTSPSKGRNSSSATHCSTPPSISVRSPPMRSQMAPDTSRLTMPKPSISDSIIAPCAGP